MFKFKVEDRVVLLSESNLKKWNMYEDSTRGVVVKAESEDKITVKWDASWRTKNTTHKSVELIMESEANIILSRLEKEFEVWANPIRNKIKEAAHALEVAHTLASLQKEDLAELHELVEPLINAMDNIGWKTSSLSC